MTHDNKLKLKAGTKYFMYFLTYHSYHFLSLSQHPPNIITSPTFPLHRSNHTSPLEDSKFISERTSLSSGTDTIYPLTPNICVADGRIEFIRSPLEGSTYISSYSYGTDEENGNVNGGEDEEEGEKGEICDDYNKVRKFHWHLFFDFFSLFCVLALFVK